MYNEPHQFLAMMNMNRYFKGSKGCA